MEGTPDRFRIDRRINCSVGPGVLYSLRKIAQSMPRLSAMAMEPSTSRGRVEKKIQ